MSFKKGDKVSVSGSYGFRAGPYTIESGPTYFDRKPFYKIVDELGFIPEENLFHYVSEAAGSRGGRRKTLRSRSTKRKSRKARKTKSSRRH